MSSIAPPQPVLPFPHVEGVEMEHCFVEVRDARFHVAEAGEGPPLVLAHGWPQHWWAWRFVIPHLAQRYRVICPDARALGWSTGADGRFGWDDLAEDLLAITEALGHERFRLVGHDWGGQTGYRAALMRPDRIERYVAVAVVHPYTAADVKLRVFTAAWHLPLIGAVGNTSMTRLNMGERCLRVWRHRGEFTPDEWAVYVGAIRRPASVRATVKFDRSVYANEIVRTLRHYRDWRLRVPTLHVAGACDPLIPHAPETYGPYADDMRIVRIPDCGHFVPEEATQEFLALLDDFL